MPCCGQAITGNSGDLSSPAEDKRLPATQAICRALQRTSDYRQLRRSVVPCCGQAITGNSGDLSCPAADKRLPATQVILTLFGFLVILISVAKCVVTGYYNTRRQALTTKKCIAGYLCIASVVRITYTCFHQNLAITRQSFLIVSYARI